jgi:cytochrome c556
MMANHQKQNMRDHLAVVQQIVAATAAGDISKVRTAAERIGYSESMAQMCEHMGAQAAGFTEQALRFHHTADSIATAAERRDADAVLTALAETLATCTACHARYKQSIVAKL